MLPGTKKLKSALMLKYRIKLTVMKTGALIFGAKGLSLAIPIFWKDLVNTLTG